MQKETPNNTIQTRAGFLCSPFPLLSPSFCVLWVKLGEGEGRGEEGRARFSPGELSPPRPTESKTRVLKKMTSFLKGGGGGGGEEHKNKKERGWLKPAETLCFTFGLLTSRNGRACV
eukprot:Hpha_TRINITY_DN15780_c1_g2::TRINITY_DN15780_c1_g2_i3::g.41748::m.41748